MRRFDRVEGWLWILALVVAVAVLPAAVACGTGAAHAAADRIRAENAAKVRVTATIIGDPVRPSTGGGAPAGDLRAEVGWSRSGHTRHATVDVPATSKPGDALVIWLGGDGRPTAAPRSARDADAVGLDYGFLLALGTWWAAGMLVWGAHRLFAHRREAEWAREWSVLGRGIGHDR